MQSLTYRYSKINSIIFTIIPLGVILFSIPSLLKYINFNNTTNWLLIIVFDLLFTLMLLYIVVKQLIPALKNKIALEFNKTGIISYVKNIVIEWKDIEKIDLRHTQTSSSLYITFKWQTDHGSHIRIPLGFVSGSDSEIYNSVVDYFKKSK